MQKERDLTARARHAMARRRPIRAVRGRFLPLQAFAAHGGTRLFAATMCALIMLACGDERPPWSGFPIFPADAGAFELSPELASGLLAAQAAFAKQLAEQGTQDAGPAPPSSTNPEGGSRTTAGAPASKPKPRKDDEAEREMPHMADDAASGPPPGSEAAVEPAAADGGIPLRSEDAGAGLSQRDAGVVMPTAGDGQPMPAAGSGGSTTPPAAGEAAPTPDTDAGVSPADADGGS